MKLLRPLPVLVILAAALMMVGCDGQTPQPTPIGSTPTSANPAPAGGNVITYATTGGIAGVQTELVIKSDGAATLTERGVEVGQASLPEARMSEIEAKLAASNFMDLEERYGNGNVADDFLHTITVQGDSGIKSVTMEAVGGKDVTPPAALELFALMAEVEEEVRTTESTTGTPNPSSYRGRMTIMSVQEVTGERWQMTISESGEATVTDGDRVLGDVQVAPARLEDLRARMERANFFNLKAYYGSRQLIPNDRVFTINLQSEGENKIVRMEQHGSNSGETPPVVRELFNNAFALLVSSRAQALGTPVPTP